MASALACLNEEDDLALSGNLVFAIIACQIKWLHIMMFPVFTVTFNLTQLVQICYIKTSAKHDIMSVK